MPQPKKKVSKLDEMAKAKGFPNYAAFVAWNEKYRSQTTSKPAPKQSGFRNFLQTITDTIPIQFTSRRVTATLDKAREK